MKKIELNFFPDSIEAKRIIPKFENFWIYLRKLGYVKRSYDTTVLRNY